MGATLSQNVSNIILKSVEKTTNKVIKKNLANYQQSNIITIENSGNVDISNNKNIQVVKVNMNLISDELQKSENRIDVNENISQLCKNLITNLNLLNVADSKNILENLIQTCIVIKNQSILNCKIKIVQSIKINIKKSKNVKIANNINEQYINTLQNCVESITNENKNLQKLEMQVKQFSDNKLEGLSLGFISTIIIGIVLMCASVGIFGSYYLIKFILPISSSILSYIFYKKSLPTITLDHSNKSLKSTCDINLVGKSFNNINDAKSDCLNNNKCIGFGWDESEKKSYRFDTKNKKCIDLLIKDKDNNEKKISQYPRIKIINENIKVLDDSDTIFFDNYIQETDIVFLNILGEIWINKNTTFENPLSVIKTKKYWNNIFCSDPTYQTVTIFDTNLKIIMDSIRNKKLSEEEKQYVFIDVSDPFFLKKYKIKKNNIFTLENQIPFLGMTLNLNDATNTIVGTKEYNTSYLYLSIICAIFTLSYIVYESYIALKKKNEKVEKFKI